MAALHPSDALHPFLHADIKHFSFEIVEEDITGDEDILVCCCKEFVGIIPSSLKS